MDYAPPRIKHPEGAVCEWGIHRRPNWDWRLGNFYFQEKCPLCHRPGRTVSWWISIRQHNDGSYRPSAWRFDSYGKRIEFGFDTFKTEEEAMITVEEFLHRQSAAHSG